MSTYIFELELASIDPQFSAGFFCTIFCLRQGLKKLRRIIICCNMCGAILHILQGFVCALMIPHKPQYPYL